MINYVCEIKFRCQIFRKRYNWQHFKRTASAQASLRVRMQAISSKMKLRYLDILDASLKYECMENNTKHHHPMMRLFFIGHHTACISVVSSELSNQSCCCTEICISSYMFIKTASIFILRKHLFEVLRMDCLYRLPPKTIKFNVEVFLLCYKLILKWIIHWARWLF